MTIRLKIQSPFVLHLHRTSVKRWIVCFCTKHCDTIQ